MDIELSVETECVNSNSTAQVALPRTLVVSIDPWNDDDGYQTFGSLFRSWSPEQIGVVYVRNEQPNSSICDNFFQISENETLRSILNPNLKAGRAVSPKPQIKDCVDQKVSKKAYYNFYVWKNTCLRPFFNIARELVWLLGNWKTKKLENFIEEFNPNVVFVPVFPAIYILRVAKQVIKVAKKPIVAYFLDDSYTYRSVRKNPVSLLERWILRRYTRWIVARSAKVAVIVPKQKEIYDALFKIDSVILTQSVDFSKITYKSAIVSSPIRMVYTGSLAYGRWKTLILMAEALGKINIDKIHITLDVYTQYQLNDKQKKLINRNGCRIVGKVERNKVAAVQSAADVLLFVESLDRRYRNAAYLSFSTKITDYFASGRCVFAVGAEKIAPIEYFQRFDSAITASNFEEIVEKLRLILDKPYLVEEYGKKGFQCGLTRHSKELMESRFQQILKSAISN